MRYTFFEFENFKGIRRARLDLESSGRVYTLVGLNESGKTTVLEAIDQLQAVAEDGVSPKHLDGRVAPNPHKLIPISERTNFNDKVIVRCGIELDESDVEAATAHLRRFADGYRLEDLHRTITLADEYSYENSQFVKRTPNWSDLYGTGRTKQGRVSRGLSYKEDRQRWVRLASFIRARLPVIWFFPNFLFDFPEKIYIEPTEDESNANRFYRALFQDVLDALNRSLDTERHVIQRARSTKSSNQDNLQQVLLEASRHVTTSVVAAWNRIFANKPMSDKSVRIDIGEDPLNEGQEGGRLWVRFRLEDTDGLFAVSQRSLGFRWFFVYLMLTTYRGRRKSSGNDMLFLFDEPASNLHPTAQGALLESLEALSRGSVVIYTTHSHHLIQPAWLETTSVVANTGLPDAEAVSADFTAQQTDITVTQYRRFAARHPNQSHYFQPILDVLDYVPSRLELVPDAVMVEGKSDFYLLAYYETMVLRLPGNERLRFMPGGGAGTLDDVIQLYLGWSRPFVALLDSDKAGRAEAERYLGKFGAILKPHLLELAEVSGDNSAKGIESQLTLADKLAFQRVVDETASSFRKKAFAFGVQEALVSGRSVKLSADAKRALGKITKALRVRLTEVKASHAG